MTDPVADALDAFCQAIQDGDAEVLPEVRRSGRHGDHGAGAGAGCSSSAGDRSRGTAAAAAERRVGLFLRPSQQLSCRQ